MDTFGLEKLGFRDVNVTLVQPQKAHLIVSLAFVHPIDVGAVCENVKGSEYEVTEGRRGGQQAAVIKTECGTILLSKNGARLWHISDPNSIRFLGRYVHEICGLKEQRTFGEWLRDDFRRFVNEDLEVPKFLEELGVRKKEVR